jgi:CheY-like chemotaxis protein
MDVMMPICDGYEATRRLRRTGFHQPIVALTAHALREERQRSFQEGCDEHLTKPVNRAHLIATVAKFVFGEELTC